MDISKCVICMDSVLSFFFFFLKPLECRVAYTSKLVSANCIPERLSIEIDLRCYIERSVQISIRAEPRPAYMHAFKTRVEEPVGADMSLFSGINKVKGKVPSQILFEAGKEWHVCFFVFFFCFFRRRCASSLSKSRFHPLRCFSSKYIHV